MADGYAWVTGDDPALSHKRKIDEGASSVVCEVCRSENELTESP